MTPGSNVETPKQTEMPIDSEPAEDVAGAGGDPTAASTEGRVLMLAKSGLAEAVAEKVLGREGIELVVRRTGAEAAAELARGAAVLIVGAEAITPDNLTPLLDFVESQPPWSDLPVIALPVEDRASGRWSRRAIERLGNVIFVETPVRDALLLSAVRSARRDRERQYRFRRLLSRLDELERQRSEFMVGLGHEVRNPLGVIRTSLSVLRELDDNANSQNRAPAGKGRGKKGPAAKGRPATADTPERGQPIDKIERQVEHLSRLLDEVLRVSRFSLGQLALERRTVDLGEVVRDAVDRLSLAEQAAAAGCELAIEAGEAPVQADPGSMEQILYHLVRSALREAQEGRRVTVVTSTENDQAVLRVRGEDGEPVDGGIPAEVQSLPIVRNLVELHGGTVEVEPGPGFAAVARLPRRGVQGARRPARPRRGGESLSVLVVEDSDDAREALQQLLELHDFRVTAAADGGQALARMGEAAPDVALVDIGLPDMEGYELARRLREVDGDLPLIAMTGYGQPEDRRRALDSGFDLHLVKPVDPEQLFDLLSGIGESG
ncbi:MAG TPA: response regulator [Thermoanaerobaculia bacterium]|nr:response regulator [Thermoanaerobaculia bacterium]